MSGTSKEYRQYLTPQELLFRQLDRVNKSISNFDPTVYESLLRAVLATIPNAVRDKVMKQSEKWLREGVVWDYKRRGVYTLGTPLSPLMAQSEDALYGDSAVEVKTTDGEPLKEDWSNMDPAVKPYVISPIPRIEESMDYEVFHRIISEEMEKAGLTWSPAPKETRVYEPRKVESTPTFLENKTT